MKRLLFLFIVYPSLFFAQNRLSDQVDACIKAHPAFSGIVLLADQGKPVYFKAYGYRDLAKKIRLQKTDILELASVSKQFTAMVVMMLQEKGKLQYDDLVEKYLDIPYKGITIRQLLTHTSGLPDYQQMMDENWDKSKVADNTDILACLNQYAPPSRFPPGEKYEYSNTGYVLLASISEKASGADFTALCREWIFKPLGMADTDLRTPADRQSIRKFAKGYTFIRPEQRFAPADSFPSSDYTIWLGHREGPGRISSTAADLLKWDQALYTGRLVSSNSLKQAWSPMKLNNDSLSAYGFGWILDKYTPNEQVVWHSGDNPGYRTWIIRNISKRKTIILLCNNDYEKLTEIKNTLEQLMFR
jgi:CubicO group peptidase (beta-lactamase class C family)